MADFNIVIGANGDPSPTNLDCKAGDKITWTNNNSQSINSFTLPSCVSPTTSPAPIASGATTRQYTVNAAPGDYAYSYVLPSIESDTRGGTIDVGS